MQHSLRPFQGNVIPGLITVVILVKINGLKHTDEKRGCYILLRVKNVQKVYKKLV